MISKTCVAPPVGSSAGTQSRRMKTSAKLFFSKTSIRPPSSAVGLDNGAVSRASLGMLQRGIEAFNARELEAYFGCFHPDVVYRSRADEPDAGVRIGLDELKRYTSAWLETFDDLRFEVH